MKQFATRLYWAVSCATLMHGGTQTPALGLVHEAGGHANNALDDRDAYKARKQIHDSQYDNAEERKVYEEVENPAAVHCGEDVAPDHAGEPETVERADERPK